MPASASRTCRRCTQTFPLSETYFYQTPSGVWNSWCRECVRSYSREHRSAGGRQYGVEIEFVGASMSSVEREMIRVGLPVSNEGYNHRVSSGWKIVPDGSICDGAELVSPPMRGADGHRQIRKACQALAAAGARVNNSCGLHVHHDCTNLGLNAFQRLFAIWAANQDATNGLVAASRRHTSWAQPLTDNDLHTVATLPSMDADTVRRHFSYSDRYRALNVACFPRYGTVEVRQHQGTMNARKIIAWVQFGQAIVKYAKGSAPVAAHRTASALLDTLAESHGLPTNQHTYLQSRADHFAGTPVAA